MVKTILVVAAVLVSFIPAGHAQQNLEAWAIAHHRLVVKWRHEPRCGQTVGGYSCSKKGQGSTYRFYCPTCAW